MEENIEKAANTEVTFVMPNTEEIGKLKDMEAGFQLNIKYRKQEDWALLENKPVRCYFMGMKEIPNDDGELVNCGLFVSEKECFISGQMTLIEAVSRIEPRTPIQITFRGKKKNKTTKGSTNLFDVEKLV